MENYLELIIRHPQEKADVLIAFLQALPFVSFWEEDSDVTRAYIVEALLDPVVFEEILHTIPFNIQWTSSRVEKRNWNKSWETNFSPIAVDDFCYIRGGFS